MTAPRGRQRQLRAAGDDNNGASDEAQWRGFGAQ
jgi:hypothetical protein